MLGDNFKADNLQVGNLKRAISETTSGELIFRDKFVPEGITIRDLKGAVTEIVSISSALQEQINGFVTGEVSQTELLAVSAGLQEQIDILDTNIDTISGDFDIHASNLDIHFTIESINISASQIIDLPDNNNTSLIETVSAGLQDQIDILDITSSTISGDLSAHEADLTIHYTMDLINISASQIVDLVDNDNTSLIESVSAELKADIANFIGGKINLNINQNIYDIFNTNITTFTNPVCSVVTPLSGNVLFSHNVYDVRAGAFTVETSMTPPISGYQLNWMAFSIS